MSFSLDYNTLHDIAKPDLPYVENYEFSVTEHFPPKPQIKNFSLTPEEALKRQDTDVLTRCLTKKPLPGRSGPRSLRLKICKTIRVGDEKKSQIVLVDVISGQLSSTRVVAKLYDPLYYDHANDDVDPFLFVDVGYTRETAAYSYLHSRGEKYIPEFYGSFSMNISHSDEQSRTVRLILLEYVDGAPMVNLDPKSIEQPFRKAIMEQVVNIESRLYQLDLKHSDTNLRNIIVEGLSLGLSKLRVRFIDFGHAKLGRSPNPESFEESRFLPGIYISPILRWYKTRAREPVSNFADWIDWD